MQNLNIAFGNYMRNSIAEVATTEDVVNNIEVEKEVTRHFLEEFTGFFKNKNLFASTASVKIKADARVKAGVDIAKYFNYNVNPDKKEILIRVPEPKILSREIYSTIVEMEDGTLIEVSKEMLNEAEADIRVRLEEVLREGKILEAAKTNFKSFF